MHSELSEICFTFTDSHFMYLIQYTYFQSLFSALCFLLHVFHMVPLVDGNKIAMPLLQSS